MVISHSYVDLPDVIRWQKNHYHVVFDHYTLRMFFWDISTNLVNQNDTWCHQVPYAPMNLYQDPVSLSFSQLTSLLFVGHHVVVAIQPLPKRQPTFPRTPAALIASVTSAEILSQWQVSWREAGPASTGMPPCVSKSNWATICTIELFTPTNYSWCD